MVIYINDLVREKCTPLSKLWRDVTFKLPNVYLLDQGLKEFEENRETFKATLRYAFLEPAKTVRGKVVVMARNCGYRKAEKPDVDTIEKEAHRRTDEAIAQLNMDVQYGEVDYSIAVKKLNEEFRRIDNYIHRSLRNAELYDEEGVVPVISYLDIQDQTRINVAAMLYNPESDLATLNFVIAPERVYPRIPKRKAKRPSLAELIKELYPLPDLSPA
ncbi:MAG: hypothetical protein WCV90_04195 [Candidatus Woesearchaeota archaeon]|jgi:hypothetical protein